MTPAEDPIDAARRWLEGSGLSAIEARAVLTRLAGEPFEAGRIVHGASDALGDILDEMAFSTDVDLTEARRLLTLAWKELASPRTPGKAAPTRAHGDSEEPAAGGPRSAVEAFEEGRRAGGDLNQLLDQLERDLGLDGPDSADDPDSPAPDFPGVVGAMVEEFLWETREVQGDTQGAERFEILRCLGRFGKDIGVFEELSASDLLRFSAFWLAERRELADGRAAADLLDALGAFCMWAESAHEMPLNAEFGETLEKLRASLPRITEANLTLGAAPGATGPDDPGELYEIVAARPHQGWKLLDRRGREHTACAPLKLSRLLKAGDRLRGRIELDGQAVVFCLYPPEAAGLLSS